MNINPGCQLGLELGAVTATEEYQESITLKVKVRKHLVEVLEGTLGTLLSVTLQDSWSCFRQSYQKSEGAFGDFPRTFPQRKPSSWVVVAKKEN